MENVTEMDSVKAERARKEAESTAAMLNTWAQRQGHGILKQMELKRHVQTLSLHWPKVKQGWLGGFVSGVQAGFQLGYKTSSKLSETMLDKTHAVAAEGQLELPLEQKKEEITP